MGKTVEINGGVVQRFAAAIAVAEGFYKQNSLPQRLHNPGDLTIDIPGGGKGIGQHGIYIVYANDSDGWQDLYLQVTLMLNNRSRIYNREMTITEVSQHYTTTDQENWARIVADQLGVTIATKLSALV